MNIEKFNEEKLKYEPISDGFYKIENKLFESKNGLLLPKEKIHKSEIEICSKCNYIIGVKKYGNIKQTNHCNCK
jgi:hypothetical protein